MRHTRHGPFAMQAALLEKRRDGNDPSGLHNSFHDIESFLDSVLVPTPVSISAELVPPVLSRGLGLASESYSLGQQGSNDRRSGRPRSSVSNGVGNTNNNTNNNTTVGAGAPKVRFDLINLHNTLNNHGMNNGMNPGINKDEAKNNNLVMEEANADPNVVDPSADPSTDPKRARKDEKVTRTRKRDNNSTAGGTSRKKKTTNNHTHTHNKVGSPTPNAYVVFAAVFRRCCLRPFAGITPYTLTRDHSPALTHPPRRCCFMPLDRFPLPLGAGPAPVGMPQMPAQYVFGMPQMGLPPQMPPHQVQQMQQQMQQHMQQMGQMGQLGPMHIGPYMYAPPFQVPFYPNVTAEPVGVDLDRRTPRHPTRSHSQSHSQSHSRNAVCSLVRFRRRSRRRRVPTTRSSARGWFGPTPCIRSSWTRSSAAVASSTHYPRPS